MTFLNLLLDNNGIIFYALFAGVTGTIGWSWYSASSLIKSNLLDTAHTVSKGIMTSPVTDTTLTPRTFLFTHDQLSEIQNHAEQSIQTSPRIEDFVTISEKAVQTASDLTSFHDIGVQARPDLIVDTINLSPGFEKWVTYSHSEKSAQTLFNKLEKAVQTLPDPDLIIHGQVPPIGKFVDPIFMTEVVNQYNYIDGYMAGSEMLTNYASLLIG